MEITLEYQVQGFLLACVTGVAIGAFFDIFRVYRALFRCGKRAVFFQDIVCLSIAGLATFLVALAANWGNVRFYLLAGEAIGGCLYFLTFGEVTVRVASLLRKAVRAFTRGIWGKIIKPFGKWAVTKAHDWKEKHAEKKKVQKKSMPQEKIP